MDLQLQWIGASNAVTRASVSYNAGTELKDKALNLLVQLHFNPHLWPWHSSRPKEQVKLPCRVVKLSLRDKLRSPIICRKLRGEQMKGGPDIP